MVTTVESISSSHQVASTPRFVELVGPAGAGKSTLVRALCNRNDQIMIGTEIAFRNVNQLPILIGSIPLVLSSLFYKVSGSRRWTWDEIKYLVYLKKWDRVLEWQAKGEAGMVLLDHGPIFKLATLHAFGPDWLRSTFANAWWKDLFQQWAALLDLIVWLDASDTLLETRINARNQKHQVKGKTRQEVLQFLARYRSSYQFVLKGLATANGPTIINYDTSQVSLDELCENILSTCKFKANGA
jgi:shikimate kinase